MDSLLSKAQRCVRKADSLVKYGLYDESLSQLDKSIVYLNELKSITTCYESIQMLNVQLESIDRKMRSIAIKRSESLKKKSHIETLINNSRRTSSNGHNQNQAQSVTVLVGDEKSNNTTKGGSSAFKVGAKLEKDEKSVLEELSTTNAEFKKVNEYLINEIEQLKRENDYLKVELLKMHMNDSLSESSSLCSSTTHNDLSSSQSISNQNISGVAVSSSPAASTSINNSSSSIITNSSSSSSGHATSSSSNDLSSTGSLNKSSSSSSSSSHFTKNNKNNSTSSINNHHPSHEPNNNKSQPANCRQTRNSLCNRIDLSRYINDDDEEDDYETDNHSDYGIYSDSNNPEDCCFTSNLSVNEFIID